MLTIIPLWSSLVHLLIAALAVTFKRVMAVTSNTRLHEGGATPPITGFLNEFMSSVAWVVVSLECLVVGIMWSKSVVMVIIATRLLLLPPLLGPTHFNPCSILQQYLLGEREKSGKIQTILLLLAELLAIPAANFVMLTIWHLLTHYDLSSDHAHFLGKEPAFFLSVSPLLGFTIEFFISFLTFLSGLFFPNTNAFQIAQVTFVTALIYMFGPLTGAFTNPMVALAYLLMWHRQRLMDPLSILTHILVFWLGPLLGTAAAVKVKATISYSSYKQHRN